MKIPSLLLDPTILIEALLAPEGDSGRLLKQCLEMGAGVELCATEAALGLLRRTAETEELQSSAALSQTAIERWIAALELRLTLLEASRSEVDQVVTQLGDLDGGLSEVDLQSVTVARRDRLLLVTREVRLQSLLADLSGPAGLLAEAAEPQVVIDLLEALGA